MNKLNIPLIKSNPYNNISIFMSPNCIRHFDNIRGDKIYIKFNRIRFINEIKYRIKLVAE